MNSGDLRSALTRLELSQIGMTDVMIQLGDTRPRATIERTVRELARPGRSKALPWAVVVLVNLLERSNGSWR